MCSKMRNSVRPFPVFRSVEVIFSGRGEKSGSGLSLPAMNLRSSSSVTCSQTVEVCNLLLQCVIGAVKPKSAIGTTVNSQRSANGVAKLAGTDGVVLWEHLDAVCQA